MTMILRKKNKDEQHQQMHQTAAAADDDENDVDTAAAAAVVPPPVATTTAWTISSSSSIAVGAVKNHNNDDEFYGDDNVEVTAVVQTTTTALQTPPLDEEHPSDDAAAVSATNTSAQKQQQLLRTSTNSMIFDISYHPGHKLVLYSPPRQRQKWDDAQQILLPRVNWGDLFFDLFYVAATYNVSLIVVDSPNGLGLLYAASTFWPIMALWVEKTYYDSKYVCNDDDMYHQLTQIIVFAFLAIAVLHTRTVDIMSNTSQEISMFAFALVLVLERLFSMWKLIEVYYWGIGQRHAIQQDSIGRIQMLSISTIFYFVATIFAGISYFGNTTTTSRFLAGGSGSGATGHAEVDFTPNYVPIWLCLGGFLGEIFATTIRIIFFFPTGGRHKEITVPMNVDFCIHRYGEYTMLMLGESIFSILIVAPPDNSLSTEDNANFRSTFYVSLLTVILLQHLHFRSQPHDADYHAIRRHKNAGMLWSNLQYVYSLALVCLGASFTFFLEYFAEWPSWVDKQQQEKATTSSSSDYYSRHHYERSLGGEQYGEQEDYDYAAYFYSGSLVVIFFCLDAMTLLHLGKTECHDRCVCSKTHKKNYKGMMIVLCRVALLAFTATLSIWYKRPEVLVVIGLACVIVELSLRKLGGIFLFNNLLEAYNASSSSAAAMDSNKDSGNNGGGHRRGDDVDDDDQQWPNVTHARAVHKEEDEAREEDP